MLMDATDQTLIAARGKTAAPRPPISLGESAVRVPWRGAEPKGWNATG
jgi:hypothetical protein